jgi:hypothetical protein
VIDEVQNEEPLTSTAQISHSDEASKEQPDPNEGFISKFTSKFKTKEDKQAEE